jgi:hypothetical protein
MFLSVDLFVQTLKLTIKITVPCINIGKDLKHTYYKYTIHVLGINNLIYLPLNKQLILRMLYNVSRCHVNDHFC